MMPDTASISGLRFRALPAIILAAVLLAAAPLPVVAQQGVHVVQPGETLLGIAVRYGTTVPALIAANRIIDADMIWVGQRLTIPGAAAVAEVVSVATTPAASSNRFVM